MKGPKEREWLIMSIAGIAFFLLFRTILNVPDASSGLAYEITCAILGAVMTVTITAVLLRKQTQMEAEKELAAKYFEAKHTLYQSFFQTLQEIFTGESEKNEKEDPRLKLQLLMFKLGSIASREVVEAFQAVTKLFLQSKKLEDVPNEKLMEVLPVLCAAIRRDLMDDRTKKQEGPDVLWLIESIKQCKMKLTYDFYELVDPEDLEYYREIEKTIVALGATTNRGTKGYSVSRPGGPANETFLWVMPSQTGRESVTLLFDKLSADEKERTVAFFSAQGKGDLVQNPKAKRIALDKQAYDHTFIAGLLRAIIDPS